MRAALRFVNGNIAVFSITDLLGNFARSMVFPYASLFIVALGGDAAQIGFVAFVGQFAGLVLLPVAGHITDRADRVHLIVLAGFLIQPVHRPDGASRPPGRWSPWHPCSPAWWSSSSRPIRP